MPATLFKLAAPAASALRPTGPAAIDTFPPSVIEPACANVRTAAASFRIKTKSVSSKPIWPPKPAPAVPMALGADQEPSGRRATTTPLPNRPEPRKPALRTVRIARPYVRKQKSASRFGPKCSQWGIEDGEKRSYLCFRQYLRRYDLVGSKGLPRVYERSEDFSRLLAFLYESLADVMSRE